MSERTTEPTTVTRTERAPEQGGGPAREPAPCRMPDLGRSDVATVYVGQCYVPGPESARSVLREITGGWSATDLPPGILSANCYLSTGGETVLTYVQCTGDGRSQAPFATLPGMARAGAVEYRIAGRVVPPGVSGVPSSVVIATFDVDGPERQEKVIGNLLTVLDGPDTEHPPGMLSANFHAARDGSRVLNYAEWTSDEAHEAFLESSAHRSTRRVSGDVPGVRPIGFKRYHLHAGVSR